MNADEAKQLQDELRARVQDWERVFGIEYSGDDAPIENMRVALTRYGYSDRLPLRPRKTSPR